MYEIYGYDNVQTLFGIFNAVAAISGSGDYLDSIKVVLIIGFMVALFTTAFKLHEHYGWKWLAGVVLAYNVLFVPRVTVGIIDRLGAAAPTVVDNVPFGVALFGHVTSKLGDVMTTLFETAFTALPGPANLPAELTYQGNGLHFGSRILRTTRGAMIHDPNVRTDMSNFIENCVRYDLADGGIDPVAFARSGDVWSLMGGLNPARFTPIWNVGTLSYDVVTCPAARTALNGVLGAQLGNARAKIAFALNPSRTEADALVRVDQQIERAYATNTLGAIALSSADLLRQNMMLNMFADSAALSSIRTNDPTAAIVALGQAQATQQTNSGWIVQGRLAEQAMPLIRNVIEGLLYALFPLSFLLMMVLQGKALVLALKSYIFSLIWIQLWPPLYAVTNYFSQLASAKNIAAAAKLGPGLSALALENASSIFSNTVSDTAVASYMVVAIVPLSWALLKGMEAVGQAAITGMSSLANFATSAGGAAALGNATAGNMAFDQVRLAPNIDSGNVWRTQQQDGTVRTTLGGPDGQLVGFSAPRNEVPLRGGQSAERAIQLSTEAASSFDASRASAVSAVTQSSAAYADLISKGMSRAVYGDSGSGFNVATGGGSTDAYYRSKTEAGTLAAQHGITEDEAARIQYLVGAGADFSASAAAGRGAAAAQGTVRGNATLSQDYGARLQHAYEDARRNMDERSRRDVFEVASRATTDERFVRGVMSRGEDASRTSAEFRKARTFAEQSSAEYRRGLQLRESARSAKSEADAAGYDWMADGRSAAFVEDLYGRIDPRRVPPGAAQAIIRGALDERHLLTSPTRFNNGQPVPVNAGDIRNSYDKSLQDPDLRDDTKAVDRANRRKVGPVNTSAAGPSEELVGRVNEITTDAKHRVDAAGTYMNKQHRQAAEEVARELDLADPDDPKSATKGSLANRAGGRNIEDWKQSGKNLLRGADDLANGVQDAVIDAATSAQQQIKSLLGGSESSRK